MSPEKHRKDQGTVQKLQNLHLHSLDSGKKQFNINKSLILVYQSHEVLRQISQAHWTPQQLKSLPHAMYDSFVFTCQKTTFSSASKANKSKYKTAEINSTNLVIKRTTYLQATLCSTKLAQNQQKAVLFLPFPSSLYEMKCLFIIMLFLLTFNKFSDILGKAADAAGEVPRVLLDVEPQPLWAVELWFHFLLKL